MWEAGITLRVPHERRACLGEYSGLAGSTAGAFTCSALAELLVRLLARFPILAESQPGLGLTYQSPL